MNRRTFISSCTRLLLFKISGLSATKEHTVSFAHISDTQFGMANVDAQGKLSRGIRKTIYPQKIPENHYIKEFQIKKAEKEIENSKKQSLCDSHFEWVANSLNKVKSAKQIFVFGHHPIFTHDMNEKDSYSNFNKTERSRYIDLFNKFKVSAYHCGHTHKFDIVESQHCCKQVIVGAVGIPLGIGATSGYYAKNNWIEISKANPDCAKL